jgi:hypothetical protein
MVYQGSGEICRPAAAPNLVLTGRNIFLKIIVISMTVTGEKSRMKFNLIATAVLGVQLLVGLAAVPALAAGKSQTLTGEVSDAMCGAKHEMPGKAADCTQACIKHGSNYALVVGDKVYTLETSDQAALAKLSDLAGAKAKVTGEVDGTTITVKSVAAGS